MIRKLANDKKRTAKKRYIKMAKLVKDGKLEKKKFLESYYAWKNYISHGNCVKFGYEMDKSIHDILGDDLK